jgi:hypothetical protein
MLQAESLALVLQLRLAGQDSLLDCLHAAL